jgi:hypothetical protein
MACAVAGARTGSWRLEAGGPERNTTSCTPDPLRPEVVQPAALLGPFAQTRTPDADIQPLLPEVVGTGRPLS